MNFYFCEFSCFRNRVVADSILGFDPESIGNQFSDIGKASPALKSISNIPHTDVVSSLEKNGIVRFSHVQNATEFNFK